MKKWTVMLIPHDRSSTRTLELSNLHFWVLIGSLALLTFISAFFLQRNFALAGQANDLKEQNQQLRMENAMQSAPKQPEAKLAATNDEQLQEYQIQLRADYESRIEAIAEELRDLYEMEAKARQSTGIRPRVASVEDLVGGGTDDGDGRGGSISSNALMAAYVGVDERLLPAHVIYGMMRPSADLLQQEIKLRINSLDHLVQDVEAKKDVYERRPTTWPLVASKGRITSRFGLRRDPFTKRFRHHSGTDIAAPTGTPVQATGRGVVKESTWHNGYGNLVKIDHGNGIETWFAHLSARLVEEGQKVERGDVIGKLGSTGRSTGPHLHYEVHVDGKVTDAERFLD